MGVSLPRKLTDNASGVTPPAANAKIPDVRVSLVLHGTAVLSTTAFQNDNLNQALPLVRLGA